MIIDTHVHLNDLKLYENLVEIIKEANNNMVEKMIVVGYDKESSLIAIDIASRYEGIYCAIGIHPSEVKDLNDDLKWIEEELSNPKVIAIGETGLDYYWDKSFKEKQQEYLIKQLEIANKHNLPVIIHSRSATNETYEILKTSNVKGVMHCYSGSLEMALKFIDIGFLLGIGGVVTFKNAGLVDVVRDIDLKYLLSETDAPYLAPTPYRGKTNYPKYTKIVVEEIAKIKNMSFENVMIKLEENTYNLFNI